MRKLLLTTLASLIAFCVFTMTSGVRASTPTTSWHSVSAMDHAWKVAPASASTTHSLTFKRAALDKLLLAAQQASWCGGYVIIDTNDKEVLVASCDQ